MFDRENPMKEWTINYIGTKWYQHMFHKIFLFIWYLKKLLLKVVVSVLLTFMWFASVIWITGMVAPIIETALRKLRESRADEQDRKHWIVYNKAEKKYTIEQMRELIAYKWKERAMLKDDLVKTIETYYFLSGKYKINLRRPEQDWDFYDIDSVILERKEWVVADEIFIHLKHKHFNPDDIVWQKNWIEEWYKTMAMCVLNNLTFDNDLKRKLKQIVDWTTIIEHAIREFISLKRPMKNDIERSYMTDKDYQEVVKEIDTHLLITDKLYS